MSPSGVDAAADRAANYANSRRLFFGVYPSIMLPMFLGSLDQTIVATALTTIASQMGEVERIPWIVISYLIATTIAAPVYGRLGDVLGRKRMMFVALGVFIVTSLMCAASTSVIGLTAARLLQGFGGGGLMTLTQALIGEAVPPRERVRFQGYLATIYVSANTFGPVAGGYLTQHYGWQSVFLINLPLGLLAVALVMRIPPRPVRSGRLQFDILGVGLFAAVIAPLLLGLEQVQRVSLDAMPLAVGFFAIAAVALVLLLRQERRAKSPLLSLQLLRQPSIWRCNCLTACVGATLLSLITFLPVYLLAVRNASPSQTGLLLLPLTVCVAVGSICTGQIVARTGRTAIVPSIGYILVVAAIATIIFFAPSLSNVQLSCLFGLLSVGLGTANPVVNITVQVLAGPKQLGAGAASVQFSRSVGSALGTALVGVVLFASLTITDGQTAALFRELVERGPAALAGLSAARQIIVQHEIADAFRAAFLTVGVFAVTGLVLAWSIPSRRL
jgi:EmrB/QacA subfamily drug resistance transporter